jgi:hypothetical protein
VIRTVRIPCAQTEVEQSLSSRLDRLIDPFSIYSLYDSDLGDHSTSTDVTVTESMILMEEELVTK